MLHFVGLQKSWTKRLNKQQFSSTHGIACSVQAPLLRLGQSHPARGLPFLQGRQLDVGQTSDNTVAELRAERCGGRRRAASLWASELSCDTVSPTGWQNDAWLFSELCRLAVQDQGSSGISGGGAVPPGVRVRFPVSWQGERTQVSSSSSSRWGLNHITSLNHTAS